MVDEFRFYRWRPHPWHGLEIGPQPPNIVHAYIEITPFDSIKSEFAKKIVQAAIEDYEFEFGV